MIKTDETHVCARKTLGPWLVLISVLIVTTVILAFYFANDIRRSKANKGQSQIGGLAVPSQMGQAAGITAPGQGRQAGAVTAKPIAFVPPWHGQQNLDGVTSATPKAMSFNQAIGIVSPSVVSINTSGSQQQMASGIIVNSIGYVLTNEHVVSGAKDIVVTLTYDQLMKSYPAQVFDSRPDLDLAILKMKSTGKEVFTPVPLGDSDLVYIGQWVTAIGNPFGLSQTASSGMVSNANRTLTAGDNVFEGLIQTDVAINPGSSGGALVNPQAEVIGVSTAIYSPTQAFSGISFAIPINQAKMAFPDLIEIVRSPLARLNTRTAKANMNGPRPSAPAAMDLQMMAANRTASPPRQRCWLGTSVSPINSAVARELNVPTVYGVLVNRVIGNSPAAKAGLMRGDVIFRVDSRSIKDEAMLWSILADKMAGDTVELTLFRKGTKKTLPLTLEAEPPNVSSSVSNPPPITANAKAPHSYRGQCANCHTIMSGGQILTDAGGDRLPNSSAFQTGPMASAGTLPSPLKQNAAGKEFVEGHWLGLEVIELTTELATEYQIPRGQTGVLVDEVTLEAAESGILAGDMVQSIGGFPTPDLKAFFNATQRERVMEARKAKVVVSRRGSKQTFFMTARNTNILGLAQMEAAQPIQPSALRPHRYRGACTNCHVFMQTGGQLPTDAGDILPNTPPITANAKAPHRNRGKCANCHVIG